MQCPNCDSIRMFSVEPEGDGKCSVCHGSGYGGLREMFFECDDRRGTGRCQTCFGIGVVEEYEFSLKV
jgi:hypothetical protein